MKRLQNRHIILPNRIYNILAYTAINLGVPSCQLIPSPEQNLKNRGLDALQSTKDSERCQDYSVRSQFIIEKDVIKGAVLFAEYRHLTDFATCSPGGFWCQETKSMSCAPDTKLLRVWHLELTTKPYTYCLYSELHLAWLILLLQVWLFAHHPRFDKCHCWTVRRGKSSLTSSMASVLKSRCFGVHCYEATVPKHIWLSHSPLTLGSYFCWLILFRSAWSMRSPSIVISGRVLIESHLDRCWESKQKRRRTWNMTMHGLGWTCRLVHRLVHVSAFVCNV